MKRGRIGRRWGVMVTLGLAACSPHPSPQSPATARPPLPDPLAAGWKGRPVCELLHEDDTLRALRCTFAPGQGHERHFHAPHFGYALSGGRMRITDARGSREVELATGSSFNSPGLAWHEVENIGSTTVAYLILEPRPSASPAAPPGDTQKGHTKRAASLRNPRIGRVSDAAVVGQRRAAEAISLHGRDKPADSGPNSRASRAFGRSCPGPACSSCRLRTFLPGRLDLPSDTSCRVFPLLSGLLHSRCSAGRSAGTGGER